MKRKYVTDEERQAAHREAQKRWREKNPASAKNARDKHREANQEAINADKREANEQKKRASLGKNSGKLWTPTFSGVDGESFLTGRKVRAEINGKMKEVDEQAYLYLFRHDLETPLLPEFPDEWTNGLRTARCLSYLTRKTSGGRNGMALVGFFLNFDFEWILKDLPQSDYKALQKGETVEYMDGYYRLTWIPSKFLQIEKMFWRDYQNEKENADDPDKPPRYMTTRIQDTQGFFQTSFVDALDKWGLGDSPLLKTIEAGKAARGAFEWKDVKKVQTYNLYEQLLLEELLMRVHKAFKDAYDSVGLSFDHINAYSWSGPGVFSNDFLRQTLWTEEHPAVSESLAESFWENATLPAEENAPYPFTMAYYGGRIECTTIGRVHDSFNYDITSAYPYATSLLPSWTQEDFHFYEAVGLDQLAKRPAGMVHILFDFPLGWTMYPFPVRVRHNGSPNVYYPAKGETYIMTPELYAFFDHATEAEKKCVIVLDGILLDGLNGRGDALSRLPECELSTTARYVLLMAALRVDLKKVGAWAEKALKLILNSIYGKTIQQVGAHKYFSDFASSWITSVCRSLIWRAIAPVKETNAILMTMTDGLYSRVELSFCESRLEEKLGNFEKESFSMHDLFKPGVYRYDKGDGKGWHYKVRGFFAKTAGAREALFHEIDRATREADYYGTFAVRNFLTRNVSLDGWKREPFRYQFYDDEKEIKSELRAKRGSSDGWKLKKDEESRCFFPKFGDGQNVSEGYTLKFVVTDEDIMPEEDTKESLESFLERLDSLNDIEDFIV